MMKRLTTASIAIAVVTGSVTPATATNEPAPQLRVSEQGTGEFDFPAETVMRRGSFWGLEPDWVIAVHGVRRIPGGTAVYVSQGLTPGERRADRILGQHVSNDVLQASGAMPSLSLQIYDPATGQYWFPVRGATNDTPLAPRGDNAALRVPADNKDGWTRADNMGDTMWSWVAIFPELPDNLATVDLDVTGRSLYVQDLPVKDGALLPAAEPLTDKFAGLAQYMQPFDPAGWPPVPTAEQISAVAATAKRYPNFRDPYYPTSGQALEFTYNTDNSSRTQRDADATRVTLQADVAFAFDSAELTPLATKTLDLLAADITQKKTPTVTIDGHTDDTGTNTYNQDLSERRAQAVATYLTGKTTNTTYNATGHGETQPLHDNTTEENKAANRRVTITIPT